MTSPHTDNSKSPLMFSLEIVRKSGFFLSVKVGHPIVRDILRSVGLYCYVGGKKKPDPVSYLGPFAEKPGCLLWENDDAHNVHISLGHHWLFGARKEGTSLWLLAKKHHHSFKSATA